MTRAKEHTYTATITWSGSKGEGTSAYDAYARDYNTACPERPTLVGSTNSRYLSGAERHNPEDLLVAALSACHMLWYLHLCAIKDIVATESEDAAEGLMLTDADGSGDVTDVTLKPRAPICVGGWPPTRVSLRSQVRGLVLRPPVCRESLSSVS